MRKVKRKTLVKKLDAVFSEYIRRKYADKNGIVKCYTCNKKAYWKGEGMQNGHFISRKSRISSARTTTLLDEAFHGVASIKLNGIEKYIKDRLNKVIDKTRDAWFGAEIGVAGMPALIDLVAALGFLGVMVFGGMEIIDGKKSIGDFMSFFTAMALIFEPLRRLSNVSGQLQLLNASLDRLHYVYKVSPKITSRIDQKTKRFSKTKSYLEFQNVSLNYGEENILSEISIKI